MKKILALVLCLVIVMTFGLSVAGLKIVPVKSISLDKSSLTLNVAKTYNLKATLLLATNYRFRLF